MRLGIGPGLRAVQYLLDRAGKLCTRALVPEGRELGDALAGHLAVERLAKRLRLPFQRRILPLPYGVRRCALAHVVGQPHARPPRLLRREPRSGGL